NNVRAGAFVRSCSGGVRKEDGFTVGADNSNGNPWPIRISGTDAQPGVVAPPTVAEQENVSPGTFPDTAVTWKEAMGSNAIPYPDRITKLGLGLHATPRRGAIAVALFRSYQRSAFRKVTSPAPTMGLSGT